IPPVVSISGAASVNEGALYTLNLAGTPDLVDGDAIASWSINWGDGTTLVVNGNPTSATHIYLDGLQTAQTDTISASAKDADNSYSTNTVSVTVNNVAPSVTANNLKG